jgi:alcohol dehydrogenase (NADP+)
MEYLKFRNNDKMPAFGLGTWKSEPGDVYKAVLEAVKIGYRHIDCSPLYGNEAEIGMAIKDLISAGEVKREDLWITSKLWNNAHGHENVIPAIKRTLKDLQTDYLDLWLIHWPVALKPDVLFPEKGEDFISLVDQPISDTWKGMEAAVKIGLTKHIGVSNFSVKKLKQLVSESEIKPEMNQIEMHPFLQHKEMLEYCKGENIHLTAFAPLGSKDREDWLKRENEPGLMEHPVIMEIADKNWCTAAQILIKWAIQRGTSVIPKSVNPSRLKQNFDSVNIELSENDMAQIAELDMNYRFITASFWAMEGSPYTLATLWDE